MDPAHLTRQLKDAAGRLGFAVAGACPAVAPPGLDALHRWLEAGYAGRMEYVASRREAYAHPRHVLDDARSLLLLAMPYRNEEPQHVEPGQGRVARYAWGADYHGLIRDRLHELADYHRQLVPTASVRGVVDTAPLLERSFAVLAGLGWIGKNTMLLHRELGSWFFLAAMLTSEELDYDAPFAAQHCGTCRACLDACPTGALVEPGLLDARKCISYLTIELKEALPAGLRPGVGDWLFGCDVCQDVCPWNRRVPRSAEAALTPHEGSNPADLIALLSLDEAAFRQRYRNTPLARPRRRGLLRNAAIVLGNQRCTAAIPALAQGLQDAEPLVRGACAWALGQMNDAQGKAALEKRLECEEDGVVRSEIEAAME